MCCRSCSEDSIRPIVHPQGPRVVLASACGSSNSLSKSMGARSRLQVPEKVAEPCSPSASRCCLRQFRTHLQVRHKIIDVTDGVLPRDMPPPLDHFNQLRLIAFNVLHV